MAHDFGYFGDRGNSSVAICKTELSPGQLPASSKDVTLNSSYYWEYTKMGLYSVFETLVIYTDQHCEETLLFTIHPYRGNLCSIPEQQLIGLPAGVDPAGGPSTRALYSRETFEAVCPRSMYAEALM